MQEPTDEDYSPPGEVKDYTTPSYTFYGFAQVDPYLVLAIRINKELIEAVERENAIFETPIETAEETLVL